MSFAHPWFLLLLLGLPVLAWWKGRHGQQAAFLYSSVEMVKRVADLSRSSVGRILPLLRWLTLALFIVALARPQWVESETTIKASGVDIIIALDLSQSMEAEDRGFEINGKQVNRLTLAKDVVQRFISRRPSDRIGLVAFASEAFTASPLTLDHDFLLQNLERLELGTIDGSRTAIGSALSTAVNRLRDLPAKSRIAILMTDGQNNSGKIPPLTAAEAAEALAVKIYTIGVGTRGTAPVPRMDPFGRKTYIQVPVNIDEDTLKAIAAKTNGKYYRADSADTLRQVYDEIDRMEKTEAEVKKYVRVQELFHWVAIPGLVLVLVEIILNHTIWRRLP
jgi:Ca-activated chloride channel family protein